MKLEIQRGGFQHLPTLYNVVDALADLKIVECKEVALQQFIGASDLGECALGAFLLKPKVARLAHSCTSVSLVRPNQQAIIGSNSRKATLVSVHSEHHATT